MSGIKRGSAVAIVATIGSLVAGNVSAQVLYQTPVPPFPYADPSPYDQAYGARPSFEILPTPYGYAPAVRVTERCLYPNGWNVTDFDRDVNGIPAGIDHQCPVSTPAYGRVRARY